MRLVRLIANLGYGSRKDVAWMFREGRITDPDGEVLYADDKVEHEQIRIDGEPLDPPAGLVLMMNKPLGVTCSRKDQGRVVYDLLPPRYRVRDPALSTVGGWIARHPACCCSPTTARCCTGSFRRVRRSPRSTRPRLAQDLRGDEQALFASGTLDARIGNNAAGAGEIRRAWTAARATTLTEGRYHQVRRMFAATGNHVETLQRTAVGGLTARRITSRRVASA